MAVSIEELINKKDEIQRNKKKEYDLETSIGEITVELPTRSLVLESNKLAEGESDAYLVYHVVVAPNLADKKLQEAYKCGEPTDIAKVLFLPGELTSISRKVLELSGYGKDIKSKVHAELKN